MSHAPVHLHAELRDVGELDRVVLAGPDRLGEVLADLLGVDVEGGDELDVPNVVAAEIDVHEARHLLGGVGVLVVLTPWMKVLAQLPTPTIATRTLPSSTWCPLAWRRCLRSVIRAHASKSSSRRVGSLNYAAAVRVTGCRTAGRAVQSELAPHVPDALNDSEGGERRHSVDGGSEQLDVEDPRALGEYQADREDDHPHRPRRDSDLALDTQRLRPGARVGDHQRAEHRDDARRRRHRVAAVGEVPRDRREHDALLDPVEGGVEEGPEQRALA